MHNLKILLRPMVFMTSFFAAAFAIAADDGEISTADRLDILQVMANYAHHWDRKNGAAFDALFTEDAIFQNYGGGQLNFELNSLEQRQQNTAAGLKAKADDGIQTRHNMMNPLISVIDSNTVVVDTYFLVTWQSEADPAPVVKFAGTYKTTISRTSAGWKISRQEVHAD